MQIDCTENKNPLVRGGTNQEQRYLESLNDKYVQADESRPEDMIVYARDLSRFLNYYNSKNLKDGSWFPFFSADVSAQLAVVSVQNIEIYKQQIKTLFDSLKSKVNKNDAVILQTNFGLLYSALLSMSAAIDNLVKTLPDETYRSTVQNLIKTKLASSLNRLLGYYKAALNFNNVATGTDLIMIIESEKPGWLILGEQQQKATDVIADKLSADWIFNSATNDWNDYYSNIVPDYSIYGVEQPKPDVNKPASIIDVVELYDKINHASNHNLFSTIFSEYLTVYSRIIKDAQTELVKTISDMDSHDPHYALFLTFINLFKKAQDAVNKFTKNHLDFYYKEILKCLPKKPQPNQVHLIFELARHINSYLLESGTKFKAGKDSAGKEVTYTLDEDIVVNKGSLFEYKSFYKAISADKTDTKDFNGMLYASPVANSSDGIGGKLKTEAKEWHPFVNKNFIDGKFSGIQMPETNAGFAVASHYLELKEGKRKIVVDFTVSDGINNLINKKFSCKLTTEKEWYTVDDADLNLTVNTSSKTARFTVNLDADVKPITGFVAKIHSDNFKTTYPVIKFLLKNEGGNPQYDQLKDVRVSKVKISVYSGTESNTYSEDGVKEILVYSDTGRIDPSKPFLPFGTTPKKGSALIIGNNEIFKKRNSKINFSVEWADMPAWRGDTDYNLVKRFYPSVQLKFLQNGIWKDSTIVSKLDEKEEDPGPGKIEIFWGAKDTTYFPSLFANIPDEAIISPDEDYPGYDITSKRGFLKLELNDDFQHDEYQDALIQYLIKLANKDNTAVKPVEPYTPKIKTIYLSYNASTEIDLTKNDENSFSHKELSFFHVYPFGTSEQHRYLSGNNNINLMPQFNHQDKDKNIVHHIGEFYIGIKDLYPAQVLTILFQVLEGTADPLVSKPDEHVTWSYLSNNQWKDFDRLSVADSTKQLIQSGIIKFSIPADATSDNDVLQSGYHWIKASIADEADAVCRIINCYAQAGTATFADNANSPDFYSTQLPENTISKLKTPEASIKKITQPYPSFGGRPLEENTKFYTRISERLRHKARPITIWDYEHIILEEFPKIHKAKCLNHTRYEPGIIYNESAPGHVTVVTIPDLKNNNFINSLRPYTNKSDLVNIKEFLEKYNNCNVCLHVENPKFEEVRIKFDVKLFPGYDESYYSNLLKTEITQYLTPWAFDNSIDIKFGGKIYKSSLINFIEERSYVDYITNVEMYHNKMNGEPESNDLDEIVASTSASILVSANSKQHVINIIHTNVEESIEVC